jgi:hypothetical protein
MNLEDMENFRDRILKKFCVMPFKQSDGGIGLMGKGSIYNYGCIKEFEAKNKRQEKLLIDLANSIQEYIDADGSINMDNVYDVIERPEIKELLEKSNDSF